MSNQRIGIAAALILGIAAPCGCNLIKVGSQIEIATSQLPQPLTVQPVSRDDFWSAMGDLNLAYAGSDRSDSEEADLFAVSADLLFSGRFNAAEVASERLWRTARDPQVEYHAREVLLNALLAQGAWRRFLEVAPDTAAMAAGDTSYLADPNEHALVSGWAEAPPAEWIWGQEEVIVPMRINRAGHAMVEVVINGVPKWFIIDTCADMSVITKSIAEESGVIPNMDHACEIGTSTIMDVSAIPASIDELKIGDLTLRNHRVYHMNDADLEFRLLFLTILKIEGILGWNAIRAMHLELDYAKEQVLIAKPNTAQAERKIGWAGESQPLVRVLTDDGTPLWFRLDTGSTDTFLYSDVYKKLDLTAARTRNERVGGAGGFEKVTTDVISDFALTLDRTRFLFSSMSVRPTNDEVSYLGTPECWARADGLMGIDIAKGGKLIIDVIAGIFEIHVPEEL